MTLITMIGKGFVKFMVANVAVLLAIMLLPVFLFTDSVPLFDAIMNFLFSNKS